MTIAATVYWISVFVAGVYMLGVGYQFLPDPGKKDSESNRVHFDQYRSIFKSGGILTMVYLILSLMGAALEM
jgi:hypothetical protein